MAQRRMFSLKIIDTDDFLDMPVSARELYFQLSMRADDDGFIGNPKRIVKMVGASDDDAKVLFGKQFIIPFDSGVCVVRDWKIHNYIQTDRYQETRYLNEKKRLNENNGQYTLENNDKIECIQNVSKMDTQVRLGKVRLGKDNTSNEVAEVIKSFEEVDKKNKTYYGNKTQRKAVEFLIDNYGLDNVLRVISVLPQTNKLEYVPNITSPYELKEKWSKLYAQMQKLKNKSPIIL